eukprot:TRINITY_DN3569_c0_g1_i1.p1 TRINITY_DN3569_c0_g1~~TRINITY_DN3569_c0_g1_i1.p1  ORF type:complete len:137 (+),score=44.88 TRINITY_DN3569_c0_g1_i1:135-545(+)
MIRRPPRSTQSRSSAASDVYKRQPLQLPCRMCEPLFLALQWLLPLLLARLLLCSLPLLPHTPVLMNPLLTTLLLAPPLLPHMLPVSYTHLRAHETVLDLVCRLLLEKKKEINKLRVYERHKRITTSLEILTLRQMT